MYVDDKVTMDLDVVTFDVGKQYVISINVLDSGVYTRNFNNINDAIKEFDRMRNGYILMNIDNKIDV